jgi:methylenetetrahydrofolate reductase (NADPH)
MAAVQLGRYQPPFDPVRQESWPERAFSAFERTVKSRLFGCWMCGNCILPETAYVCPMTCPKGLRNGPCRGSTAERCFVNPDCSCTWFEICQRAEEQGEIDRLLEVNAPLDYRRVGCETILSTYKTWRKRNQGPRLSDLLQNRRQFQADWEAYRYELRQPRWWQGDSKYHPPAYQEPVSRLEATLRRGRLAITAEVAPPMEPSAVRIAQVARLLRNIVDTANFTDNPLGVARMSGLSCTIHCLEHDVEPVLQLQTRHRTRHEFEAEAVGASVVGVRNILCLTDDIGRLGAGPTPKPEFYDLDAVQALWILRRLRDEGIDVNGELMEYRPHYFLGASASPYAALPRYEAIITEKKINAGAQFLQTLPVFDLPRFEEWLAALDKRNLLGKAYLMPTVAVLKSPRHTRFMANEVPGVYIPVEIMDRMESAVDPEEEGIQIALDLISELQQVEGIHGLHLLAPNQEEVVPRLIKETGLRETKPRMRTASGSSSKNGKHKPPANLAAKFANNSDTEYLRKLYP